MPDIRITLDNVNDIVSVPLSCIRWYIVSSVEVVHGRDKHKGALQAKLAFLKVTALTLPHAVCTVVLGMSVIPYCV